MYIADAEAKDRHEQELDRRWRLDTSPIPGVDLGANPMDIRGRDDMALIRQAVRQRWPVTDDMKRAVLETMVSIMETAEDDRARVGAGKLILDAEKMNQADERSADPAPSPVQVVIGGAALKELPPEQLDDELKAIEEAEKRIRLASPLTGSG